MNKQRSVMWILVIGCVMATIFLWIDSCNPKKPEKKYLRTPDIETLRFQKVSRGEWRRFENIVFECEKILATDTFLRARLRFWEKHNIDPAVGYTAWLFQESRLDGKAVGDNGKAHGYGQMHPGALEQINKVRRKRGVREFSHKELRGKSVELLQFFMQSIHDYNSLCNRDAKNNLDLKLNFWNGGCAGGSRHETEYSGKIKHFILKFYERKKAEEAKRKRASAKR